MAAKSEVSSRQRERWDAAERAVLLGLRELGLPDVYRQRREYGAEDASWILTLPPEPSPGLM